MNNYTYKKINKNILNFWFSFEPNQTIFVEKTLTNWVR